MDHPIPICNPSFLTSFLFLFSCANFLVPMAPKNINNSPTGIYPSLVSAQILANQPDLFEPKKSSKSTKNQRQKMLPAPSKSTDIPSRSNKLLDSENRPLNQTFTIAKSKPSPIPLRQRANSFDSDFADFGPDVIFGFITRKCNVRNGGSMKIKQEKTCFAMGWADKSHPNPKVKKNSFSASTGETGGGGCGGTKLPSLEGFMPGRTCCQLQFTRSNFELIKYKRNLKNN